MNSLPLWPSTPPHSSDGGSFCPVLETFILPSAEARGAVIVCPGGGYDHRAGHEGEPIAQAVNEAGYHAFVLHYRVSPNRHPAPIMDASRAIRMVRICAEEWNILPQHIAILGFSAGGHLAGSISVMHDRYPFSEEDDLSAISNRPDASILCYPVISTDYQHRGSYNNLLGEQASDEEREKFSLEKQINANTPPAFLWHTTGDKGVPPENSIVYALALQKQNIPYELHIYPKLHHGIGLAKDWPHVATWMSLALEWLKTMGWAGTNH